MPPRRAWQVEKGKAPEAIQRNLLWITIWSSHVLEILHAGTQRLTKRALPTGARFGLR